MSVEYYLIARKARRFVHCGSDGLSGPKVNGYQKEVAEFLREAITNFWHDQIEMIYDQEIYNIMDEDSEPWYELEIINDKPEWIKQERE